MIPKLFVLLYSKYSMNCQKFIETIQENKINIPGLHSVCIDNKKIRNRIKEEKTINITVVPCILSVFDNGTIEKYEGDSLFQFIGQFIPKPEPEPIPRFENPKPKVNQSEQINPVEVERKKINRNKNYIPATNINELQFEEEEKQEDEIQTPQAQFQKLDRNVTKPNPKRIRNNDMSYDENESFFSDDQPNSRKSNIEMKKDSKGTGLQDPHGTSKKASDLQKEREMMDESIHPKKQIHMPKNDLE